MMVPTFITKTGWLLYLSQIQGDSLYLSHIQGGSYIYYKYRVASIFITKTGLLLHLPQNQDGSYINHINWVTQHLPQKQGGSYINHNYRVAPKSTKIRVVWLRLQNFVRFVIKIIY